MKTKVRRLSTNNGHEYLKARPSDRNSSYSTVGEVPTEMWEEFDTIANRLIDLEIAMDAYIDNTDH